jgi:glycosyltransferase involved in cell wall biosynthesis
LIYDVYPDIFLTSKLLSEKNLVYKFWQRINRKVFRNARYIYTITDGLYSALAKYAETDKIKVVPIWTTNNFLKPLDKASNPLIKELNLVGKFIVMYSGNFGKTHPVECLLDVARLCKSPDIHFLFVGAGDKFDTIKRSIIEEKLENCSAYSLFSVELLPLSLAMPDIGIVTLEDSASEVSIPSKTFSLMSTATPILAITKCTSSLAAMIDKYEIGCHHSSDEINDILKTILDLYQDKEKISIYRINSLKASKDFTADNVKKFTI